MIDFEKVEKFAGYGRRDAPYVFVGMEEGAPEKLCEHIHNIAASPEIAEAIFLADAKGMIRTWRPVCQLMLLLERRNTVTKEDRLVYQKTMLGRSTGNTLLLELLPYPARGLHEWPCSKFERDSGRDACLARIGQQRIELLRRIISECHRKAVICYGLAYRKHYKKLFPAGLTWRQSGQFELADWGRQKVAIVPHFASRPFNRIASSEELYEALMA